jgi:AcrR family transcriptional regulator
MVTSPSGQAQIPQCEMIAPGADAEVLEATGALICSVPAIRHSPRREQILDRAAEMFAEHGYHGASLRTIARHAGISHPGMLHHFASKDALLAAVIDRLEAHAQDALDRLDDLSSDMESLLRGLAEIWHPASHPMRLMTILDTEVVSKEHPGRFRMARLHRVHEHVLEQCFVRFAERGQLRDGIDPAFACRALFALVLNHAAREETVRVMQRGCHDDAPLKDLVKLTCSFLTPDVA